MDRGTHSKLPVRTRYINWGYNPPPAPPLGSLAVLTCILNAYLQRTISLHPRPCTLHPTPYTLHPTPYTLHPTPHTCTPTPSSAHPTPSPPLPPLGWLDILELTCWVYGTNLSTSERKMSLVSPYFICKHLLLLFFFISLKPRAECYNNL